MKILESAVYAVALWLSAVADSASSMDARIIQLVSTRRKSILRLRMVDPVE